MSGSYHIVIPARMTSQRLPGKPLAEIAGKPLVQHVFERALESAAHQVVIATDSEDVLVAARGFGAKAAMTSAAHPSGSDRIAECADQSGWADDAVVVNLQGDEPLMPAACLDQVASLLQGTPGADVASLYWPIEAPAEVADSNIVKVVVSADGHALYFSRAAIPHARDADNVASALQQGVTWRRHVGLYAYRVGALRAFTRTPATPLERAEKLEQLRFLESGRRILMAAACEFIPAGVDTPEDLERVRRLLTPGS
ncbi:MAG: 3-deoxy-manno-octulosonate cytidylyltransferase [Lysobacterales bacterium]|jgi:3-deoxy-manno-octulosonate cytidylyltransferase (CMP-KDO synthetase)